MEVAVKDDEILEQFVKSHEENYKNAVIEIIKNNTNSLVDEDIASLIKTPPLVSMDIIKQKLLSFAKKEKIVLNDENLNTLLSQYRDDLLKRIVNLKEIRNKPLIDRIVDFTPERETETIEVDTTSLNSVNKKMKQQLKKDILNCNDMILSKSINSIYKDNEDALTKDKISENFLKFMNSTYQKQLIETMTVKIMVKDRTLINGVIEQGERYLFTKSNSHIFDNKRLGA